MNNKPDRNTENLEVMYRHQETVKIFESKNDTEIWAAFNRGDEMAFNYLFRTYTPLLFRYGCQFRVEQEMVQDAIQNLFIYLRGKRGDLSEVHSIKGYLFRSLQRELLKQIKLDKNRVRLGEIELEGLFPIQTSAESNLIVSEGAEEQFNKLKVCIDNLTPRQRQAILLLYEEGFSYKEIAEIMDFAEVKSARKLVYRALTTLRSLMTIDQKKK
ncbi:RNA polymerase sigma-70 factor, ECF subfamily [Algoriphagus faecimaris]|uniref:RNA polymerase sigma-70 factor, ECF subfamily n=1 Tax=Algoriphagus faecimaris TaxID=686796 RepID=A0A1G6XGZ6_9BACT|nr:RNA polymerase sigma factor [Algoriphagus faecimaris]SDD77063.1 RNA polymerase sigma-70 factor, ECF subfamily [Algoriphagus faecimaris]